jgi:hypothetical protein
VTQTEEKPLRSCMATRSATVALGTMHTGCTTKPGVWFLAVLTCGRAGWVVGDSVRVVCGVWWCV